MKWIIILSIVCLMTSCNQTAPKHTPKQEVAAVPSQSDSLKLITYIQNFDSSFETLRKNLYDSVSKYQTDGIDFSDITGGLEQKYSECKNEMEKTLLGFKLAQNYYIHFKSSNKKVYREKAEPLFYSFLCFNEGEVASL